MSSSPATLVASGTSTSISETPARSRRREKNCTCTFIRLSRRWRDQIFSQNADVREIAIPFHVIESISDHEFICDFKADVVGVDGPSAGLLLLEQHTKTHTQRPGRFELLENG